MSHVQYVPPAVKKSKMWIAHVVLYPLVAVAFLSVGLVAGAGSDVTSSPATVEETTPSVSKPAQSITPRPKVVAEKPPTKVIKFGAGTHEVGVDIKAGKYKSVDNGALCYWARLSSLEDEMAIKANHLGAGNLTVVIKKTDKAFKTSGCNDWVFVS